MDFVTTFWLPILVSAVGVWMASAMIWMALPHHKKDWDGLPDEEGLKDAIRSQGLPPGNYSFPYVADRKSCKDPEFQKKWEEGPTGVLYVWPKVNMGKNMFLTFLTNLAVSFLIAYVASHISTSVSGDKMKIFQVIGTIGIIAYCFAFIPNHVWFGTKPRTTIMNIIDGVIYGLITGGAFALLWPDAGHTLTLPGV